MFFTAGWPTPRPMIADSRGIYLFDTQGRRYIDASGGPVLVNIGHGVPEVVQAMTGQAQSAAYIHSTMFTSQALEDYSEALAEVTPLENPRFFYLCSGSEAVGNCPEICPAGADRPGRGESLSGYLSLAQLPRDNPGGAGRQRSTGPPPVCTCP